MSCPFNDEKFQVGRRNSHASGCRKVKKSNKKSLDRNIRQKYTNFVSTMSSWAENYASAATWQFKHQVAYWKAKAVALEYENKVLHDIIRKNYLQVKQENISTAETESAEESEDEENDSENEENNSEKEENNSENEETNSENIQYNERDEEYEEDDVECEEEYKECDEEYEERDEESLEVSEEFIQFLANNVKIKEQVRRERELLKAKRDAEDAELLKEVPRESAEECKERMKTLYGEQWQRISALEMSFLSNFILDSDELKPSYWPNIPFNFSH